MALADITLADGQGTPANHVFTYISTQSNRVIRSELAAPPEQPLLLTFAHSETKISGANGKSHLMRIDKTVLDTDGITQYKANIRLAADIPNSILTDGLADDLAAYIRNWATSANVRNWLRGSVG